MDIDKAIQSIQIDRMAGDITDEQANMAIEKLNNQQTIQQCIGCGHYGKDTAFNTGINGFCRMFGWSLQGIGCPDYMLSDN